MIALEAVQLPEEAMRHDSLITPGVPKNYPDPKKLLTEDCIRPKKVL